MTTDLTIGLSMRIADALAPHFPAALFDERFDAARWAIEAAAKARKGDGIVRIEERTMRWHAIRSMHIGGSEIAALYGEQRDFAMSHFTLWQVKAGKIPPPVVEHSGRIKWGTYLEPHIARWAADEFQWSIEKGGYVIDRKQRGMACSLDYIITEPGPTEKLHGFTGPGVLQVKNSDLIEHMRGWTGDEPPLWIILQLQHETACAGFEWGYIVCLVGGNELKRYGYSARPAVSDDIRARVEQFWRDVERNKPPLVDGSGSTADTLRELYPTRMNAVPIDLSADNELPTICAGLLVATADRKGAEANEDRYKNQLKDKMAGYVSAVCEGYRINVAVTPEKAPRPARAGEIIGGRKEVRRYTVKEEIRK
jgi:predicted phage-related endonuclease